MSDVKIPVMNEPTGEFIARNFYIANALIFLSHVAGRYLAYHPKLSGSQILLTQFDHHFVYSRLAK